jgi:hypothetical protein
MANGDAATTTSAVSWKSFLQSKFDNVSLILLTVFFISVLVWVDKHGNTDFEKWMETVAAGIVGGYLSLITASRQAWQKTTMQNGNGPSNETVKTTDVITSGK